MRFSLLIISTLLLSACSVVPHYDSLDTYFVAKGVSAPTKDALPHCFGYGCRYQTSVTLSDNEWKNIVKPLKRKAKTPIIERQKIAQTLARFERVVGAKTGSNQDVAGTFQKTGDFQLDCADESVDMSLYLKLLDDNHLLKYHHVDIPKIRGFGDGGYWLHQTAVIEETQTGEKFAVDAWWKDNGQEPYIIPLEDWFNGWRAEDDTANEQDGA